MKLNGIVKRIGGELRRNSPGILTALGIVGMVGASVFAVQATPKALKLIEDKKTELEVEKLSAKETVKTAWRCYIPAMGMIVVSAACLIVANGTNAKRNAALSAAYTLTENTLREYQRKVVEEVGEEKEKEIRAKAMADRVQRNPVREVILTEQGGDINCYDALSGRYFKSDKDTIERVVNDLNKRMRSENYISLNEFYRELGLDSIELGDMLGWSIDKNYVDISYSSHLDAIGTPCLVLEYLNPPVYDYM